MEVDEALLQSETARATWEREAASVQRCAAWLRSALHCGLLPGGGARQAAEPLRRPLAARAVGILLASDETISELNGTYRVNHALPRSFIQQHTESGVRTQRWGGVGEGRDR